MADDPQFSDYPVQSSDKIRFADTDRQGHVNNAVFATFLETGRVEILYGTPNPLSGEDGEFVIARLELDFRAELRWPGQVAIGTRVSSIGRSSMKLSQVLFQDGRCAAFAETVIVRIDKRSRRPLPLSPGEAARLRTLTGAMVEP